MRAPQVRLGFKIFAGYLLLSVAASVASVTATFLDENELLALADFAAAGITPLALVGTILVARAPSSTRAQTPAVVAVLGAIVVVISGLRLLSDNLGVALLMTLVASLGGLTMLLGMLKAASKLALYFRDDSLYERTSVLFTSTIVLLVVGFLINCLSRAVPGAAVAILLLPIFGAAITFFSAFAMLRAAKTTADYF
ncbi:MAG: hypothetical protein AAGE52_37570 [Myxococcota bacterium]